MMMSGIDLANYAIEVSGIVISVWVFFWWFSFARQTGKAVASS